MTDEEALATLRNEVLAIVSPGAQYIISIGWATDFQKQLQARPGKFVCKVVKDQDWDRPREEWRFPRTAQAQEWLGERLRHVRRMTQR